MKSIGAHIREMRELKGWSQRQLAIKADISNTAISRIERDKYNPSIDTLTSIAYALNVNVTSFLNKHQGEDHHDNYYPYSAFDKIKIVNIPIVGTVRAGHPITAEDNIAGYVPMDMSRLQSDKNYYALKITGDSMDEEIEPGSLVICEKTSDVYDGDLAVIGINGSEATIKKIQFVGQDDILLMPLSKNPSYKPRVYNIIKDEIFILGKIVMSIRSY